VKLEFSRHFIIALSRTDFTETSDIQERDGHREVGTGHRPNPGNYYYYYYYYYSGEWRKLHNEELSDLYSLPNIVRVVKSSRMRWARHVARMGQGRGVYRVLVGRPEGKRPLARPRRRWGNNIKMDLQEVGRGCEDCMELAQDRDRWRALVSTVMNLRVPKMREIS